VFQEKEKKNYRKLKHVLCSVTVLFEDHAIYEMMWKNIVRAGQATDNIMVHVHWVLETKGYKHTLRICNTELFFTAALVA
jgi:hypothetical protein